MSYREKSLGEICVGVIKKLKRNYKKRLCILGIKMLQVNATQNAAGTSRKEIKYAEFYNILCKTDHTERN